MNNRKYGRANEAVSEIGMGGHREGVEVHGGIARTARFMLSAQERARVVGRAIDQGVTYFDTTFGCELASLGESFRLLKRREGLFASGMRVDFFGNFLREDMDIKTYTRREVESRLMEFGFDSMDQFMLGALDGGDPLSHPHSLMEDAFEELARLRDQGKIRCIGFSCHSPNYAAKLLDAFPNFDAAMIPYSFANREAEGSFAVAARKTGVAVIAMKALVWCLYGMPVTLIRNVRPVPGRLDFDPTAPIGRLGLKFLLHNPLLTTCVPAMNSVEAVDENVSASRASELSGEEVEQLESYRMALVAEDHIPLAIGGLLQENLRSRAFAIAHICNKLGYTADCSDWQEDDAEDRARSISQDFIARLRSDPKWAPYIP